MTTREAGTGTLPTSATLDPSLDAVRAVALLSMFVAHFAPTDGPGGLLGISEYLTAPLFAFLIGWGSQLGAWSARSQGRSQAWSVVVRGAVVLVVGLALEPLVSQIYVILPWLALLGWAMGALVRLRSRYLVVLSAVLVALEPSLLDRSRDWLGQMVLQRQPSGVVTLVPDQLLPKLVELAAAGETYRLTWLVPAACLGVLVARHAATGRRALLVGASAGVVAVGLLALGRADVVLLEPYSGRYAEMGLDAALVVAVALGVRWSCGRVPRLGALLAPTGAMALSLYVVQVLASQAWIALSGRSQDGLVVGTDNSWLLLGLLVVLSLVLPRAWRAVLGDTPVARGPLEGPVSLVTRRRAGVHAS